jgi:hypothetical protein
MKSDGDGRRYAYLLDSTMDPSSFAKRSMRPQLVIVGDISPESDVRRFAQDNQMVDALASDRSYQPFSEAVLPRGAGATGLSPMRHGAQSGV